MTLSEISAAHAAVLGWYAAHGRALAFRRTRDPWAVLVSEVMAQQTQAQRAAGHWERFLRAYPSPAALAAASPAEVIRAWRGLGYNRRALALRGAAAVIVERHDGTVPDDLDALAALPGIGPYTARAVLAFAFDRPLAPLDTNVRRVLSRAFGLPSGGGREVQRAADALVPPAGAAAWSHALMDIGATLCLPRLTHCPSCPLRPWCSAATTSAQASASPPRTRATRPSPPFPATTRWLRGRIVDRLRDAEDGDWVHFDVPIGSHGHDAVVAELARLAAEGLLEQQPGSPAHARLAS